MEITPEHKNAKVGDFITYTVHAQIVEKDIHKTTVVQIGDPSDKRIDIGNSIPIKTVGFDPSDATVSKTKLGKTDMKNLILANANRVMIINFNTIGSEKHALKLLQEELKPTADKVLSEKEFDAKAKEIASQLIVGKVRTIRGYHTGHIDENGYLTFYDMEMTYEKFYSDPKNKGKKFYNMRRVNLRKVNYVVIGDLLTKSK